MSRLFNPTSSNPMRLADSEIYTQPSDILIHTPESGIYSLLVYDQDSETLITDEKSIVISIHGTTGTGSRAAHGVWFAAGSDFNSTTLNPYWSRQNSSAATLHAAIEALARVSDERRKGESIYRLVIKTDSELLAYGISEKVWRWQETGFRNKRGRKVAEWRLWKQLHEKITKLERQGIDVRFWLVDLQHNREAQQLAKELVEIRIPDREEAVSEESGELGENMDCYIFWKDKAKTHPSSRALARTIGIEFPTANTRGLKLGMMYPIRRLVTCGLDRPENFKLLFGPCWDDERFGIVKTWREVRLDVLSCPPPGAPSHFMAELMDEGATRWAPRGPSLEEETMLRVKKMREQLEPMWPLRA